MFMHHLLVIALARPLMLSRSRAPYMLARSHRTGGLDRSVRSLAATSGVVQIDVENVRGKTGFRLGHDALLAATAQWTHEQGLFGRVVMVVDHGKKHEGSAATPAQLEFPSQFFHCQRVLAGTPACEWCECDCRTEHHH